MGVKLLLSKIKKTKTFQNAKDEMKNKIVKKMINSIGVNSSDGLNPNQIIKNMFNMLNQSSISIKKIDPNDKSINAIKDL
uniref:Uncharacterized protein n=1 Tax=Pithovirus LCPAC001 TaxID=2506585 RepID=A0A481Z3M2_9VIRU|nr:MAG: hypothetical protein LCPAC001_01480 [Pithovirus LCPAC001]